VGAVPKELSIDQMKALGADLGERLSAGMSLGQLTDWMGGDAARHMYLAGMAFGTIRWNKIKGRPKDADLASGFVIHHWAVRVHRFPIPERKPELVPDTATYDLPDEGDDHRVGLTCTAMAPSIPLGWTGSNDVFVFPASGVVWEGVARPVGLTPGIGYGHHFDAKPDDGPRFLPDIVF
jgi:hypothetical protein